MTAHALDSAFADVVRRVRRSTVHVYDDAGRGAGVVWRDGLVVTNAHVVSRARPFVETGAGRTRGRLVARDERFDLALVYADLSGLDAHPADARDSAGLRCGEIVIAVGNPIGLSGAAATGTVIHAGKRFVAADVRLAPGNSGGPLVDAAGCVVGINSMIAGGQALAVPVETVRAFVAAAERATRRAA
jgi:serine protease Do